MFWRTLGKGRAAGFVSSGGDRPFALPRYEVTGGACRTALTIDKNAIEEQKKGASLMPEKLGNKMTMRELRDLVAYLSSLKAKPTNEKK